MNVANKIKPLLLIACICLFGLQCVVIDQSFDKIPPGTWRGELEVEKILSGTAKSGKKGKGQALPLDNVLMFNFEIKDDSNGGQKAIFINGPERIEIEDVIFVRTPRLQDSFYINFPVYDSHITGHIAENVMAGEWVVRSKKNYSIPFVGRYGKNFRFANESQKANVNIGGEWEMDLEVDGDSPFKGIGIFKQEGNKLYGTVKTETGDYRFMEGNVVEDNFYLSAFDGAHSFFIRGKSAADGSLFGSFSNGNHYKVNFVAKKNDNFQLGDPNELTFIKEGYDQFDFSFPNMSGDTISFSDANFDGKPKLIQIMGTWCPNCRDETNFLVDFLEQNDTKDLEIVALAFERHIDNAKAFTSLNRYKEKLNIPYQILLAGNSSKADASAKLPMLNRVISYPTLIFINRKNEVIKIHTGFNGPATDEYDAFKTEFKESIDRLIAE